MRYTKINLFFWIIFAWLHEIGDPISEMITNDYYGSFKIHTIESPRGRGLKNLSPRGWGLTKFVSFVKDTEILSSSWAIQKVISFLSIFFAREIEYNISE